MNKVTFEESGMKFGKFAENHVFRIEKSKQYGEVEGKGIKTCEFILKRDCKRRVNIIFVEAKKSCPNHFLARTSEEKKINYEEYVNEIVDKMRHSLCLYSNILLERYAKDSLSDEMFASGLKKDTDIQLVLVIKNAEKEWLVPFRDVFRNLLRKEMEIWRIHTFLVINEDMARQKKLVV